jgi:hypothetical protein
MMASRGMGNIAPSKMPKGTKTARRDNTDFTQYAEGGETTAGKDKDEKPLNLNLRPKDSKHSLSFDGMVGNDAYGGVGGGGKATFTKKLTKDSDVQAWLEGGGYKPKDQDYKGQVTGAGVRYNVRFKDGGKVNAAGNYTKPSLRKRIVSQVKAAATQGTGAGQWSARKAQLVAKKYKAAGGGYRD